MPPFNTISRRSTSEIVLSRKNLNPASKVANWIIVDTSSIFVNFMLSLVNSWYLVFIRAKDHYLSLSVILYILSFNLTVAYRANLMF